MARESPEWTGGELISVDKSSERSLYVIDCGLKMSSILIVDTSTDDDLNPGCYMKLNGNIPLSGREDGFDEGLALPGGNAPKGSVISPKCILCLVSSPE